MGRLRGGLNPGGGAFALLMFIGSLYFIIGNEISLEVFTSAIFMVLCIGFVWVLIDRIGRAALDRTYGMKRRKKGGA